MIAPRLVTAVLLCWWGMAPAAAQLYTQISGLILDTSEAGIPQALVSVVNEETGFRRVVHTGPDGRYVVASLEPGSYKITVRREGFRTVIRFGVGLKRLPPVRVDFTLPVGSMQEVITVEGTAPLLRADDASVSTEVAREELENVPSSGRGLLGLLELTPGLVATPATRGEAGQFTSGGQRPNAHYFTVDGVSANSGVSGGGVAAQPTGGALPGMSAFGSLHSLISLDALQEFRVHTSTAVPEFGRLPGAHVTLTSRAGSAELHGSLSYYTRHERLDASDWFANRYAATRVPLRMHDFGGALGGPVRRNRTYFFISYEGMRLRQRVAWHTSVPSSEVRQNTPAWLQPVWKLFPQPNGPERGQELAEWSGQVSRPSRLDAGSVRLDHAFTPRVTVFARYANAPSANQYGNTQINLLDLAARSLTVGLSARPRPNLVLDSRWNGSRTFASSLWQAAGGPGLPNCEMEPVTTRLLRTPGLCDYLVRVSVAGAGQALSGREGERRQTQLQALQNASLTHGTHAIRLGFDYRRLAPVRYDPTGALSVIAESVADLASDGAYWKAQSRPQDSASVLTEISLVSQDTWRVTPRLTLVYGLRWEFSPAPVPGQPAYYLDQQNDTLTLDRRPVWRRTYRNFAPRVGAAFRPWSRSSTVVRAGVGTYYDSSLSIATDLVSGGPLNIWQYTNPVHAPFSSLLGFGFTSDLRLPVVKQWSTSVEHAFGERQVASATYLGSTGRHLIRREMGGPGSTDLLWLALATNHGSSDYHGLQLQYRRRLTRDFQALASYSWSHSLDNSSSDSVLHWAGDGSDQARDRGSSDFDVRHALTASFHYEMPRGGRLLRNWAVDGFLRTRTGFPMTVLSTEHYMGVSFANVFRPNVMPGQPLWIADASAPGGRRLSRDAFGVVSGSGQGNLGRNAITGFGMVQIDVAVQRDFSCGEQRSLRLRMEAFNALNHANFGDPVRFLVSPLFGQSTSMLNAMLGTGSPGSGLAPMFQTGGPRSVQASLRFSF